jgi:hypothetical protein
MHCLCAQLIHFVMLQNEANGEYFPALYARVMVALLVYQICMGGVIGLKVSAANERIRAV